MVYHPLDERRQEIRLLIVKAGSGSDPLQCELQHRFLEAEQEAPSYETISYCWGDASSRAEIFLDGVATMVPVNAKLAVLRMRRPNCDRTLWIDSICINQEDQVERAQQIKLMARIYSCGRQNIVWLGPETETTARAMETMKAIVDNAREETDGFEAFHSELYDDHGSFKHAISPKTWNDDALDLPALLDIYRRPWFERLWVVQEVALSRRNTCLCGPHEIPFEDVLRSASWAYHKLDFLSDNIFDDFDPSLLLRILLVMDRSSGSLSSTAEHAFDLHQTVATLRGFQTEDPRDHVFGLLGLFRISDPAITKLLDPQQDKSLDHVLRDATRAMIQQSGRLDCFRSLGGVHAELQDVELPSWAPAWHGSVDRTTDADEFSLICSADGSAEGCQVQDTSHWKHWDDPDVLKVNGFVVGEVATISDVFDDAFWDFSEKTIHLIEEIQDLYDNTNDAADEDADVRLGRTLLAGINCYLDAPTDDEARDVRKWFNFVKANHTIPADLQRYNRDRGRENGAEDSVALRVTRIQEAFHCAARNRRFFTTDTGLVGLGPRSMRPDGIVAVVYGSALPVMLRRVNEYYNLVGVCYVDGIMYGEAVKRHRADGKEDVWFEIH
ncbi:heterokaryon incompatibility protein-domain-containing protein [Neohortaea acidophila]|uniref:Heterokaryon incompatibility protein-domain-containing protein n=1 Tax=Neohortaea acidophila TaxID=245834 RepID=A0A6A6PH58_9PEZI|nr:heterokaryon incompatibility protein-domain-containing protein [Neohortaea acidophila]KAF2479245.1 heterokaryon incompatibility protein-domain-containing protein [Neohortaea acidophila]